MHEEMILQLLQKAAYLGEMKAHDCVPEGKTSVADAVVEMAGGGSIYNMFHIQICALSHDHAGTQTIQQLYCLKSYGQKCSYAYFAMKTACCIDITFWETN